MKVRSFVISLIITLTILSLVAVTLVNQTQQKESLILDTKELDLPESAQYIPSNAYLTIHFNINPNKIPDYIEAEASKKSKSQARKEGIEIRDGLFALIGLDFNKDLSEWVSNDFSFSIFNSKENRINKGWILIFEGININESSNFLNEYWENQNINGAEIEHESYQGQEILYEKAAGSEIEGRKLSMAMLNNNLILISSNKKILQEAIDVSIDSTKNQLGDYQKKDLIKNLKNGIALIIASPDALESFLEVPQNIAQKVDLNGFVASIIPKGKNIYIDSKFKFKEQLESKEIVNKNEINLFGEEIYNSNDIAIINNTQQILNDNSSDIYSLLIGKALRQYLINLESPIATNLIELSKGQLVLINKESGWLIKSLDFSLIPIVDQILISQNFVKSTLNIKDKDITVWNKLETIKRGDGYILSPKIGIILSKDSNKLLWTNTLSSLDKENNSKSIVERSNILKNSEFNNFITVKQQLSLGQRSSQKILNHWKPWQLLKTVASKSSLPNINRLNLALGEEEAEDSILKVRGMLSID
ncbi:MULTISPECIES: DUF3352 domain-containing protein [Prochlorococcus]|uniref:Uncharacterized secreted protein n=1 Tax=Prochlorococcus marinus (strain SARG / CCMP1375 / SS120) TaxID=167539 RepID=Q7VE28_PROMA|nr:MULTISPECIES: DUF3352 domain-containing protein [Prochlorococcus]AAP99232.1 Uncharacterized secreted protein [Prochlorococcus marinus subsp. marinus str. CCMP1375]KGG11499.1 hypothetical protein EV04_1024 [Prochlorococcus marinus str. LG]KGG18547.1 hypothetical protein EV08_1794 [Prochlorococcus marinus str. SS2]KGG22820.1 hypothetical protein EV09_1561 [Prochlorococcus marinus str. SS35]KGG32696.1 hypothetical protein EV10_1013 [Prochlorococcus marinus str. SS51]